MRAAYFSGHGGNEVIQIGDLPVPEISDNDVLVRVRFAALNHLDLWLRKGEAGVKVSFPHIPCGDAAGVVEKSGRSVTHVKVGDPVIVHPGISCLRCEACLSGWESLCSQYQILGEHINGTAAQFVKVPAANVYHCPPNLSLSEAAAVPLVFTTAFQMVVKRAQVSPGETVLIHAAGSGVSSAAIQIAKLYGARVIATASAASKLKLAKSLGADETIDYLKEDFAKKTRALTNGKGVDAVINHVGIMTWEKNFKAVKWGGKIVLCGASSGYVANIDLRQIFYRQVQVLGSTMGSKADFPKIMAALGSASLKPVVDSSVCSGSSRPGI